MLGGTGMLCLFHLDHPMRCTMCNAGAQTAGMVMLPTVAGRQSGQANSPELRVAAVSEGKCSGYFQAGGGSINTITVWCPVFALAQAFFYLRKPQFKDQIPQYEREALSAFACEGPVEEAQMRDLKDRVRASQHKVVPRCHSWREGGVESRSCLGLCDIQRPSRTLRTRLSYRTAIKGLEDTLMI